MRLAPYAALAILTGCGDAATTGAGGASSFTATSASSASGASASNSGASSSGSLASTTTGSGASTGAGGQGGGASCPARSTLVHAITACGAAAATPDAFATLANTAKRGEVVDGSDVDVDALPCLDALVCRPDDAPTLLFSDEPETTSADGILYADVLTPGAPYRVYVYHVNGGSSPRKFSVVALNQGATAATIHVSRRAETPPSTDYIGVGKSVALAWIKATSAPDVTVPPGARVVVDADLDAMHPLQNELVHAIFDLEVDNAVKLSIVSVAASADAAKVTAGLSVLPNTGAHVRGSFAGAAFEIVSAGPLDGARALRFGAGLDKTGDVDPNLTGASFVDGGAKETLLGNFGVSYDLSFAFTARAALAISARGGAWAAGAHVSEGEDSASGDVALPSTTTALDAGTDVVFGGRFDPDAKSAATLLSAGGSSLPVVLIAAPLP